MSQQIQITHIPLEDIQPSPLNPRKHFDEAAITELAASIIAQGVLQPILVRLIRPGKYEIVAGERRYRASLMTSLVPTIPCIIRELNEEQALDIMIIENLQRKDIHPMEEAIGFKQIMDIKHIDIKEIAARVGKEPRYVAQRLQLTHLIDEIQQVFFNGYLLVKDAVSVSALSVDDQRDLYTTLLEDVDSPVTLNNWNLKKYRHKLSDASFDITDASLLPLAGACTSCPFNSACQPLLFPEMVSDPVCQRPECFRKKTDTSFVVELQRASEDPAIVLITGEYSPEKATKELMKKHDGVLLHNQYSEVTAPYRPDREDFEDDDETEEDIEHAFQQELSVYEKKLAEFNQKMSSGGYLKAYKIGGHEKGQYVWIKLSKAAKTTANASSTGSSTATTKTSTADIKAEIQRIQDREKRAKELDDCKIWEQVRAMFKPIDNIKDFTDHTLTQIELTAAATAIFNKLDFSTREKYQEYIFGPSPKRVRGQKQTHKYVEDDFFPTISQLRVNELLRIFFLDTLPVTNVYHGIDGDAAIMMKVAEAYWPAAVETIGIAQRDIADRRAARVESRIAALQAQLKPAKKAKAPAAPKKGKGIKALISDPQEA